MQLVFIFRLTARGPSGRLTRCWRKDNCYCDDRDPRDDVDHDLLQLSLVHWHSPPFREGSELTAVPPQRPQVAIVPPEFVRTSIIVQQQTLFVKYCRKSRVEKLCFFVGLMHIMSSGLSTVWLSKDIA